jgi:hypothetical protein
LKSGFSESGSSSTIVNGRSSNGTVEWRLDGAAITYKKWEAAQMALTRSDGK